MHSQASASSALSQLSREFEVVAAAPHAVHLTWPGASVQAQVPVLSGLDCLMCGCGAARGPPHLAGGLGPSTGCHHARRHNLDGFEDVPTEWLKLRPGSGLDWEICSKFARQRFPVRGGGCGAAYSSPHLGGYLGPSTGCHHARRHLLARSHPGCPTSSLLLLHSRFRSQKVARLFSS